MKIIAKIQGKIESQKSILKMINELEKIQNNTNHLNNLQHTKKRRTIVLDISRLKKISFLGIMILQSYAKKFLKIHCVKIIKLPNGKNQSASFDSLKNSHFFDELLTSDKNNSITTKEEAFSIHLQSDINPNKEISMYTSSLVSDILPLDNHFQNQLRDIIIPELINNAFDHSKASDDVRCIANYSNEKNVIEFCIKDTGIGIKNSFISNVKIKDEFANLEDSECIEQSLELGVSCNSVNNPMEGYSHDNAGQGLFLLHLFMKNHKDAKLMIISKKGFISLEKDGNIKRMELLDEVGTFIYFSVHLDTILSEKYKSEYNRKLPQSEDEDNNISFL